MIPDGNTADPKPTSAAASSSKRVVARRRQQYQPYQRKPGTHRQCIADWPLVGERADRRLQQRGCELKGKGQQADLCES
jgi:hypothetical protein